MGFFDQLEHKAPQKLWKSHKSYEFSGGVWILRDISYIIWVFPKIGENPPKWMVKIMENPIKIDDLGVFPYFWKHPYMIQVWQPPPPQCNVPILTPFPPLPPVDVDCGFSCGWEMWPLSLHCLIMIDVEWSGAHSVVEHGWVRPNDHHKSYMVSMEWLKVSPLIAWWNMDG